MTMAEYRKVNSNRFLFLGFLAVMALAAGILAAANLSVVVFGIGIGLLAVIMVAVCIVNPLMGFYLTMVLAFLAFHPGRLLDRQIPISTAIEVFILLVFLGASWEKRHVKTNLWGAPVSIALFCYAIFFLIEFFNPNMESIEGY